jgi:hypothetical protein
MNGEEYWTVGKVHAELDQRSETFAKSRSRFQIESLISHYTQHVILVISRNTNKK